jgi:hypothetical protein
MRSRLHPVVWSSSNGRRLGFGAAGCPVALDTGGRMGFAAPSGAALDNPRWAVLERIEAAPWSVNKTEAKDPTSDFWWIDDDASAQDQHWLRVHGCEHRRIEISTNTDPGALVQLVRLWDQDLGEKSPPN